MRGGRTRLHPSFPCCPKCCTAWHAPWRFAHDEAMDHHHCGACRQHGDARAAPSATARSPSTAAAVGFAAAAAAASPAAAGTALAASTAAATRMKCCGLTRHLSLSGSSIAPNPCRSRDLRRGIRAAPRSDVNGDGGRPRRPPRPDLSPPNSGGPALGAAVREELRRRAVNECLGRLGGGRQSRARSRSAARPISGPLSGPLSGFLAGTLPAWARARSSICS